MLYDPAALREGLVILSICFGVVALAGVRIASAIFAAVIFGYAMHIGVG